MLSKNELNDLNTRVTFNINAKFLELFRSYYPKTYQKQIRRLMEEDIEKKEKIVKEEQAKRNKYLNMNRYY